MYPYFQINFLKFQTKVFRIFSVLILSFIGLQVLEKMIEKAVRSVLEKQKRDSVKRRSKTLSNLFINSLKALVWTAASLIVLSELGVNIVPLLASAGILGLAIGMGAQSIISDIWAGIFIIFEDQYQVGDKVSVLGVEGEVKDISLRRTVLENEDGKLWFVSHSQIKKVGRGKE